MAPYPNLTWAGAVDQERRRLAMIRDDRLRSVGSRASSADEMGSGVT